MNQSFDLPQAQRQKTLLALLDFLKQQYYQFTVITPLSHQRILHRKQKQRQTAPTLRDIFGWNLPFNAQDLEAKVFASLKEAQLIRLEHGQWLSNIRVASLDQDLFIHSSFPTLEQDAVFFGPDTYRFAYHLKQYLTMLPHGLDRIVELCCGASAAAITLARHFPEISEILVTDINPKALFYSQVNIHFSGLNHIYPLQSDLFKNLAGKFDLIVANPPYLMDLQERQYRHGGNELDGTDLAFNILKQGIPRLNLSGSLFLYTGIAIHEQGNKFLAALKNLMQDYPNFKYSYEEIDPDVFGEELEQPGYEHIERIALVLIKITSLPE